jgi:hypothetical protein
MFWQFRVVALVVEIKPVSVGRVSRVICQTRMTHSEPERPFSVLHIDVALMSAPLPNRIADIALHIHIVVFHRADAQEQIERQPIKIRHRDDIFSKPVGLPAIRRTGDRLDPAADPPIRDCLERMNLLV